jgi:hypothetical protein
MGAGWHTAGGWAGILTGIVALYLSFAEVMNATSNKPVVFLGGPIFKPTPVPGAQGAKSYPSHTEKAALPAETPR